MPRSFSSFRRSVSCPVSARMSDVFPWSMCPAVPMITAIASGAELDRELGRVEHATQVEKKPALVEAPEDGRTRSTEAGRDPVGGNVGVLDRERPGLEPSRRRGG